MNTSQSSWNENKLNVLLVEDDPVSAQLNTACLLAGGFDLNSKVVLTEEDYLQALDSQKWDIILSDYDLPDFCGEKALEIYMERGLDIPFVMVSGKIGEEKAVTMMRKGAKDYVMKQNISRLLPVVKRELKDAENRRQQKEMAQELARTQKHYKGIFEGARFGIFCATLEGKIIDANPAFLKIFEYKSLKELKNTVYNIGKQMFINMIERDNYREFTNAKDPSKRFHCETKLMRKDSSVIIANVDAWLFEDSDAQLCVEGMIEDITEKKLMEKKIEDLNRMHESIMASVGNL